MDLFGETENWVFNLNPILIKYHDRKHPLAYQNLYQLVIMVILSAQDSDANINTLAPILFLKYPSLQSLQKTKPVELYPYLISVKYFEKKANWVIEIAHILKNDINIPLNIKDLTALKGIGRKSAHVVLREFNKPAQGIIVDLHVLRVAPRIGIIQTTKDALKAEKQLMQLLPQPLWGNIGMALSFLGREICRPKPNCNNCPITSSCSYFINNILH
ncbi:endonuclease III [Flavobacterium sp. WC2430]|uniref:endonuclease III domain-containing protein n=1 Tax=Flavobacterium sp. WC2430 TaxID=3234137 RepID=UPI003466488A